MKRKIITINKELCNGCGLCVNACHEGAIGLADGKAILLRDDYCDGLGNCLPACPVNAITFEEREALPFNEEETKKNTVKASVTATEVDLSSKLNQWPVQIKLVPVAAPYFNGANLLIAADCTAFAYGNFHNDFMDNRITLIGCPKLDSVDYSEKLSELLKNNDIKSITVTRMIVPCCGGIVHAVNTALQNSGKNIPLQIVTISTDGSIVNTN
jgi:ferredoxin